MTRLSRFAAALAALTLAGAVPAAAQPEAPRPEAPRNVILDRGLDSLSMPHVQVCQRGFERLFGVPEGVDPDEALMVRGARQTVVEDPRLIEGATSTLELQMPYERMLPGGAVIPGIVTCLFTGEGRSFDTAADAVTVSEEGETRALAGPDLALFR